jgi:haloacetate dehalogenase
VTSIQPEVWVENPAEAVAFYEAALGATVLHRVGDGNDIVAQLNVGDGAFWVAASSAALRRFSPAAIDGATSRTLLVVDDPGSVLQKAVAAGATELSPVSDEHGWRLGRIVDPFGQEWEVGAPLGPWPPGRAPTTVSSGAIPDLEYRRLEVRDADYLIGKAGSGPPVLLLHGFPQTHYCWRHIIPSLAREQTVFVTDIRGYGATSAGPGGPRGEGYSKREMAGDLVELMARLGVEQFSVVGHDRGARVAYRMALDHPNRIERLAVLNVIPTIDQFERMGDGPSLGYWPWFLLAQPAPFPERLIAADAAHFLRFVFESWTDQPGSIDADAFDVYLQSINDTTVSAICADYRASFFLDQEHDVADRQAGRRIECPVLVVRGEAETQLADADQVWSRWARTVHSATVTGGHFIPEEAAEELISTLRWFLSGPRCRRGVSPGR